MARVRVSWDDSKVKTLRVSIDGVRVQGVGTEKEVPAGLLSVSWFALGNPGSPFTISVTGVNGTVVLPAPEFPCAVPITSRIPAERAKDFGVCAYMVAG